MTKPNPQVGLIVRFKYRFKSKELEEQNREDDKRRPCVIVLVPTAEGQPVRAMVCAITHSRPRGDDVGVEIPDDFTAVMGLDKDPQWVIASEANLFAWDHECLVEREGGGWTYGVMTQSLLDQVRARYVAIYRERGPDAIIQP